MMDDLIVMWEDLLENMREQGVKGTSELDFPHDEINLTLSNYTEVE